MTRTAPHAHAKAARRILSPDDEWSAEIARRVRADAHPWQLQAIDDPANQDRVRMTVISMYADGFGERDLALAAMRRAIVDFHSVGVLWFAFRTDLRTDPRFKELVREAGLAEYFLSSGTWNDFCKPVGTDDFECH